MWFFIFISIPCGLIAPVMSHDIAVNCHSDKQFPMSSASASPSLLENLTVAVEQVDGNPRLHIRWAVNVDASNKLLVGTRVEVDGNIYLCKYTPSIANANLTGLTELWFEHYVHTTPGLCVVMAANLPLPPAANGPPYKTVTAIVGDDEYEYEYERENEPTDYTQNSREVEDLSGRNHDYTSILLGVFGAVLAGLIIFASCLIFSYKQHLSKMPTSTQPPVSVLLVYPAECPAFQKTVVALAEFLQEHGGCSVAVDLWQQCRIAQLGPMRWVAGQAEAAHRVLIVCPQPISCRSNHRFLGPSIPASANDLYPLVLNMVASHAKNSSRLAMFWAVQLGKSQDERPQSLPVELTACKCFSLTKDLDKLCRSLHSKKQDSSILQRPEILYNKKSRMKLQDAIGQLAEHQSSITAEQEDLHSLVITV